MDCSPPGSCPWNSPGKNTGVHSHFLLQRVLLTQGLNLGLLHYLQIPYHLSHQGSPDHPLNVKTFPRSRPWPSCSQATYTFSNLIHFHDFNIHAQMLPSPPFLWLHHTACEISVSQPGIESGPWQWKSRIITTRPPRNLPPPLPLHLPKSGQHVLLNELLPKVLETSFCHHDLVSIVLTTEPPDG